jgi:hypothetical protein
MDIDLCRNTWAGYIIHYEMSEGDEAFLSINH